MTETIQIREHRGRRARFSAALADPNHLGYTNAQMGKLARRTLAKPYEVFSETKTHRTIHGHYATQRGAARVYNRITRELLVAGSDVVTTGWDDLRHG